MKKQLLWTLLVLCIIVGFTACKPEEVAYVRKVGLSFDTIPGRLSAGFCQVHFSTDKEAYYFIDMTPVEYGSDGKEINPMDYPGQFMTLALDSAYIDYLNWRHGLLKDGCAHIASFHDHSLEYGDVDYVFNDLKADTDYWIYCFVVDGDNNKPYGDLHLMKVHTSARSIFEGENAVNFTYRVEGTWDYIYPYSAKTQALVTYVPWVAATADSLDIRKALEGVDVAAYMKDGEQGPGLYFGQEFARRESIAANRILYGIYAHNNDGEGDGTTCTEFVDGHTYYTAMSIFDGPEHAIDSYDIYKFRYEGPNTHILLKHESSTQGYWDIPKK